MKRKWTARSAQAAIRLGQEARNWQHEHETEAVAAALPDLIGKAFRFRNSYGAGEDWWLYALATGPIDGRQIGIVQVQTDCRGVTSVEQDSWYEKPLDGFVPISTETFEREYLAALKKLDALTSAV